MNSPTTTDRPAWLADDATWAREPIRLAEARGHTVRDDTTGTERYTCTACGRAVLRCGANIYGSAITEDCKPLRMEEKP
ncbi:hypothetical protein [Verrucosispora sp. NA02020]|uniref:hypothetical protein n=1 Tax=Verrucosispora sp. NA02020 TaxID=2742132 RepID=UPI00159215E8|nr:hypothetical protein [Verrucosispora sp. NA02020]QKW15414.1 hypothetical protein HUT12_23380 [Verrucosispora sp. NA02020]